jgi:LuxR family maltose regulon positive regulatory protein
MIEALLTRATLLHIKGEADQALDALARVLALAEPGGYVQTFVERGAPLRRLLVAASARGLAPAYVARLLSASADRAAVPTPVPAGPHAPASLVEPLSARELEVLRLLRTDMTSREIADELYVSVNTVRTHVRHVYEKLGVHHRADAVQRARELGLL